MTKKGFQDCSGSYSFKNKLTKSIGGKLNEWK